MKKIILSVAVLTSTFAFSQKVGINTSSPVRTLDVEGDLRVKTLTDKSADAAYTNVLVQNPATGLIDMVPKTSLGGGGAEPWFDIATNAGATANTKDVYQLGKVNANTKLNIGDLNVKNSIYFESAGSRLITIAESPTPGVGGGNLSIVGGKGHENQTIARGGHLILRGGDSYSETFITVPYIPGEIFIAPGKNVDNLGDPLASDPAVRSNIYLLNSGLSKDGTDIAGAKADTGGKVAIANDNPTEKLDVNGNARIRGLVDATSDSSFNRPMYANANGVLSYKSPVATISGSTTVNAAPLITAAPFASTIPIILQNSKVGGDAASYVMNNNGGFWSVDFTDSTNSNSVVNYTIAFVAR